MSLLDIQRDWMTARHAQLQNRMEAFGQATVVARFPGERTELAIYDHLVAVERDLAAAQAQVARMRETLKSVEWANLTFAGGMLFGHCPWCNGLRFEGHKPGCILADALAASAPSPVQATKEREGTT